MNHDQLINRLPIRTLVQYNPRTKKFSTTRSYRSRPVTIHGTYWQIFVTGLRHEDTRIRENHDKLRHEDARELKIGDTMIDVCELMKAVLYVIK